jgi:hypothetical protein
MAVLVGVRLRDAGEISFRDLRECSTAFNRCIVEYMRANYSGDPAQLEEALRGVLPIAREMVQRQSQHIDEDLLRTLIVTAVAGNRFARRRDVEAAMDSVLSSERLAA